MADVRSKWAAPHAEMRLELPPHSAATRITEAQPYHGFDNF
jgi:hypothetical protein